MFKFLKDQPKFSKIALVAFVSVFVIVGVYLVFSTWAATNKGDGSVTLANLTRQSLDDAVEYKKADIKSKPEKEKKLKDSLSIRKKYAKELMENNPSEYFRVALDSNVKNLYLSNFNDIEKEVVLEGTAEVNILDDFDNHKSKNLIEVTSGNERVKIFTTGEVNVKTNDRIRVKGFKLDNTMAVDTENTQESFTITSVAAAEVVAVPRKVAVILFNFTNNTTQPYTKTEMQAKFAEASNYYKEISFGKTYLTGKASDSVDVFGYYTIPYTNDNCPANYTNWSNAAKNAAAANGFVATGYNHIAYVFPYVSNCGWGGMGKYYGPDLWLNQVYRNTIVHELGHNLGLLHANLYSCVDSTGSKVPLSTNCSSVEYADYLDTMGSTAAKYIHQQAFNKFQAGYLGSDKVQTVSTSGRYSLYPLENSQLGTQLLRIPFEKDTSGNVTKYYYVDFRQPYGLDSFMTGSLPTTGVVLRISGASGLQKTNLIDTKPTTSGRITFSSGSYTENAVYDAPILVGESYTDSVRGISIRLASIGAGKAELDISLPAAPTCIRANPTTSISPTGQWGSSGQTLTYNVTVKNNDSSACAATAYNVTATMPGGLSVNPAYFQTTSLLPGATYTKAISVTSGTTLVNGNYTFTVKSTSSTNTTYTSYIQANYNVYNEPVANLTLSLTGLTEGQKINKKGKTNISATASSSVGVASISFYLDGVNVKNCYSTATCSYTINNSNVSSGSHVLKVTAVDKATTPQTVSRSISFYK